MPKPVTLHFQSQIIAANNYLNRVVKQDTSIEHRTIALTKTQIQIQTVYESCHLWSSAFVSLPRQIYQIC